MNIKSIRYALLSAMLFSHCALATLPNSITPICPRLDQLQCKPSFEDCDRDPTVYCSGTWHGTNDDGKIFASRTDIDCNGTLISWLAAQSELVDGYKVKCAYQLKDGFGILYKVILYNEKGYELNEKKQLVLNPDND